MAKLYRGDTFPFMVKFDDYRLQPGDTLTAQFFELDEDTEEINKLGNEIGLSVEEESDSAQMEFTREDMYEVSGNVYLEVRLVTHANVEKTLQKKFNLEVDAIR